MANSLVVRKDTSLAKRNRTLRAAQYARMSTDHQRYSIQNQAAAIAAYAQQKNLTIIKTYVDEGRSGLRIKGRPGLIELIEEIQSGRADFDHVLVYDVSRWGRFQDIDEAAYYEFICKQNGVKVAYCAEQFDNDGSLLSSIIKNIKRVMAAEYSRELSVKVHTGHCRIASLGFRTGGPVTFGLRRELIDDSRRSKGFLTKGQHKALQTDRVLVRQGSNEEAAIVRWIFNRFVVERQSSAGIARQLNESDIANHHGRPWTDNMINAVLKNENFIGNIIYNRTSKRLGSKVVDNPPHLWVRGEGAVDSIIDQSQFARAQKILAERYVAIPEDEMLRRLRLLLHRKGKLGVSIVNNASGLPHATTYMKRFGSLRNAFAAIGYVSPRDCDWLDTRASWFDLLVKQATEVADTLQTDKRLRLCVDKNDVYLARNEKREVTFLVARRLGNRPSDRIPLWRVYRHPMPSGLLSVTRLSLDNKEIKDHLLLPAPKTARPYIGLSDGVLDRYDAVRFENLIELTREIKTRIAARKRTRTKH